MTRRLPAAALALLLTSAALCVWMPEPLYRTIVSAIAVIGGAFHG